MDLFDQNKDMFVEYTGAVDMGLTVGGMAMSGYGLYNSLKNDDDTGAALNAVSFAGDAYKLYKMYKEATTASVSNLLSEYGTTWTTNAGGFSVQTVTQNGQPLYYEPGVPVPAEDMGKVASADKLAASNTLSTKAIEGIKGVATFVGAVYSVYSTIDNWSDMNDLGKAVSLMSSGLAVYEAVAYFVDGVKGLGPIGWVLSFAGHMATGIMGSKKTPYMRGDVSYDKSSAPGMLYETSTENYRTHDWKDARGEEGQATFNLMADDAVTPYRIMYAGVDQDAKKRIMENLPDIPTQALEYRGDRNDW